MDIKQLLQKLDGITTIEPATTQKPIIKENKLSQRINMIKEERADERFDFIKHGRGSNFDSDLKKSRSIDRHSFKRGKLRRLMFDENQPDAVTIDIPLLIRLLEYAREDAQSDVDLHDVTEKLISLGIEGKTLSMDDYESIVGGSEQTEEITESISYDSTINAICSALGSPISEVYSGMEDYARKYFNEDFDPYADPIKEAKKFKFVVNNYGSRWYQSFYHNKLQGEFYDLVKFKPRVTGELKLFLQEEDDSFRKIESRLPNILLKIAKALESKQLYHVAITWNNRIKKFAELADQLQKEAIEHAKELNRHRFGDEPSGKSNITGQQSNQVEGIINGIFASLPKEVAAELRPIIARSDNKLQTLMRELSNRGIK